MKVTADSTEIGTSATDAHRPGVCPAWCTVTAGDLLEPYHFGPYGGVELSLAAPESTNICLRLERGLSAPGTYVTMVYQDQYIDLTLAEASALAGRLTTLVHQGAGAGPEGGEGARDHGLSCGCPDCDNDEAEPYCTECGGDVGIFIAHGDAWLHYRGEGTAADPVELFDAGHAPEVAWRPAGAR